MAQYPEPNTRALNPPLHPGAQAEREERLAEMRSMRKQEREFNRKKEYARRCRIQVRAAYA